MDFKRKGSSFYFFSYFFFKFINETESGVVQTAAGVVVFFLQPRICFLSQKKKTCKKKREMEKEWIIGPCDPFCFPFFCALSLFLFRDESNYFTRRAVQKKMKKKKKNASTNKNQNNRANNGGGGENSVKEKKNSVKKNWGRLVIFLFFLLFLIRSLNSLKNGPTSGSLVKLGKKNDKKVDLIFFSQKSVK